MRFFFITVSLLFFLSGCSYSKNDSSYKYPAECKPAWKAAHDKLIEDKVCPPPGSGEKKSLKCKEEMTNVENDCFKSLGRPVPWAHEFPPGMYYIDPRCEEPFKKADERYCRGGFGCRQATARAINKCYADLGEPEKKVGSYKDMISTTIIREDKNNPIPRRSVWPHTAPQKPLFPLKP